MTQSQSMGVGNYVWPTFFSALLAMPASNTIICVKSNSRKSKVHTPASMHSINYTLCFLMEF